MAKKILVWLSIFVLLFIGAVGIIFVSSGGIFGECENEILKALKSPDNQYEAATFIRNCGSTTDYSSILGLRKVSDRGDFSEIASLKGKREIHFRWKSPQILEASLGTGPTYIQKSKFHEITIEYE